MRKVIKLSISICIVVTVLSCLVFAAQDPLLSKPPPEKKQTCKTKETKSQPGSDQLPIQYLGPPLPDRWAPDGHLMYSPGVQNIQLSRANRKHPPSVIPSSQLHLGWSYQHHVGMGCWQGKLYAVWDMTPKDEDIPPCHLVYSTSSDGFNWSNPKDLFPYGQAFHVRFYFYHSSNGRMLVFGAGSFPTDDIREADKRILLVREITPDHKLTKVYTLIKPGPTTPPSFEKSKDKGFVAACREAANHCPLLEQQDYGVFLGEKRMKWHDGKNWPGGKVGGFGDFWVFGKAQCFYHRNDGTLISICKMGFVTQSTDQGKTWSMPVIPKGLVGGSGKLWAQKTPDGKYAMVYIPQKSQRYPMAVTTSEDGITFENMRVIHGEVSPQRYQGRAKGGGPQYLRGVAEWGGDAMSLNNDSIWVIYSVNKEDIWVSRIPIPILPENTNPVDDNFEDLQPGPRVTGWNTYSPLWAPVSIISEPAAVNKCLKLEDREPVDYARAIRTFSPGKTVDISFRAKTSQSNQGQLIIELLGELGTRPVRVFLSDKGQIQAVKGQEPLQSETRKIPPGAGLVGTYFNNVGFDDPEDSMDLKLNIDPLLSVDQNWGKSRGNTWSARWTGLIQGPYSGQVTFAAEAVDGIHLKIADTTVIDGLSQRPDRSGRINMTKGQKMPVTLEFESSHGKAKLQLFWHWNGQPKTIVPAEALSHDPQTVPENYNIFDFNHRFADGHITPVDVASYKADIWNDFRIHADCATGRYCLTVNGRQILKEARFAEPSSMVYALSLRTGNKVLRSRSVVLHEDLTNTEEPLDKIEYFIDDVKIH